VDGRRSLAPQLSFHERHIWFVYFFLDRHASAHRVACFAGGDASCMAW
jgi:hypothetical protein